VELHDHVDTIGHTNYLNLDKLSEDGVTTGKLAGKNHVFFEKEGELYILNNVNPLMVARVVDHQTMVVEEVKEVILPFLPIPCLACASFISMVVGR